jgi:hypothetical protein
MAIHKPSATRTATVFAGRFIDLGALIRDARHDFEFGFSSLGEFLLIDADLFNEIGRLGVWLRICAVAKRCFGRRTHCYGSLCS